MRRRSNSTDAESTPGWRSCASQISAMKPAREAKRAERKRNTVPSVAIAGYTNAGKSSLLNRITSAGVLVENALFATLDATVVARARATVASTRSPTRSGSCATCRTSWSRPSARPSRRSATRRHRARRRRAHPDPAGQIATVRDVIGEVGARTSPSWSSSTRPTSSTTDNRSGAAGPRAERDLQPRAPARGSPSCSPRSSAAARSGRRDPPARAL